MTPEDEAFGLNDAQSRRLFSSLSFLIKTIGDDKPHHYAMFIFTHEGVNAEDDDIVATNLITSVGKEHLHELIRDWLHKETQ